MLGIHQEQIALCISDCIDDAFSRAGVPANGLRKPCRVSPIDWAEDAGLLLTVGIVHNLCLPERVEGKPGIPRLADKLHDSLTSLVSTICHPHKDLATGGQRHSECIQDRPQSIQPHKKFCDAAGLFFQTRAEPANSGLLAELQIRHRGPTKFGLPAIAGKQLAA